MVVADVLMPGVDGVTFTDQLRTRIPGIRILYISGSPEHPLVADLQDRGEHCLLKPFTASALVAAVLSVMRGDESHLPGQPSPPAGPKAPELPGSLARAALAK
jgi:CheY-like chemotaxis protein